MMLIALHVLSFAPLLSDVVVFAAMRLANVALEAVDVLDFAVLFDDDATAIFGFRWVFNALSNRVRFCWLVAES